DAKLARRVALLGDREEECPARSHRGSDHCVAESHRFAVERSDDARRGRGPAGAAVCGLLPGIVDRRMTWPAGFGTDEIGGGDSGLRRCRRGGRELDLTIAEHHPGANGGSEDDERSARRGPPRARTLWGRWRHLLLPLAHRGRKLSEGGSAGKRTVLDRRGPACIFGSPRSPDATRVLAESACLATRYRADIRGGASVAWPARTGG